MELPSGRSGFLWRLLGRLPLVSRLREVPADALREAWSEIWTTTIFAAMPFWFPLAGWLFLQNPPDVLEGVKSGEVLIYAATLVGPLAYIITKRYGRYVAPRERSDSAEVPLSFPFPAGRLAVTTAMVICIISGIVITLQKLQESDELKGITIINEAGLAISSIFIFLIATLLLYCVSAYRNFMEALSEHHSQKISRAQQDGENEMAQAWQARREGV